MANRTKGMKVGELFIEIGADISPLEEELALASKTVKESMSTLNHETKKVKLETEIKLNGLKGAENSVEALRIKEQSLSKQMDISKERAKILNAEWKNMQKETGATSEASRRLEERVLRETKAYTNLEKELDAIINKRKDAERVGQGFFSRNLGGNAATKAVDGSIGLASTAGASIGAAYAKYSAAAVGALATVEAVGGLRSFTDNAAQAGEATYRLSQRMNVTTAEAAKLNLAFKVSGADAGEAIPIITRMDHALMTAGDSGNDTTFALEKFGVQLTDGTGKLLPMNQQIEQLAIGYKSAAEAGQAEAFSAEVLGAKGTALIPILEQWMDLQKGLSNIKTTGLLDPEESHKLIQNERQMAIEAAQLKLALGSALIPVANEIVPTITSGMSSMAEAIRNNKEPILELGRTVKGVIGDIKDAFSTVGDVMNGLGLNTNTLSEVLKKKRFMNEKHSGMATMQSIAGLGAIGDSIIVDGAYADEYNQWQQDNADLKAASAMTDSERDRRSQSKNLVSDVKNIPLESRKQQAALQAAQKKAAEEAAKANEELTNKIFELNHSQLENSLHTIDVEVEAYRKQGADEELIAQETEAAKARIHEQFAAEVDASINSVYRSDLDNELATIDREVKAWEQKGLDEVEATNWAEHEKARIREQFADEVKMKIDGVWQSELQNRLNEIDIEKKAYIKKGVDEVEAARWAEHEKTMARQETARQAMKERREEMDAVRAAIAMGGTPEQIQRNANLAVLQLERKRLGITENDRTNPYELSIYSNTQAFAKRNLMPGVEEDEALRNYKPSSIQVIKGNASSDVYYGDDMLGKVLGGTPVYRGTNQSYDMPPVSVNVTLNGNLVDKANFLDDVSDHALHGAAEGIRRAKAGAWNAY